MDSRDRVITFAFRDLLADGVPNELAQFVAYAMFPPTMHARTANKRYYKELKRAANRYAKSVKKLRKSSAADEAYEREAIASLNEYIAIAERWGDETITSWSSMILNTHDLESHGDTGSD